MSAKSPSPIDNIHRAGWNKGPKPVRDGNQIATLAELMKVPPGKVRVLSKGEASSGGASSSTRT